MSQIYFSLDTPENAAKAAEAISACLKGNWFISAHTAYKSLEIEINIELYLPVHTDKSNPVHVTESKDGRGRTLYVDTGKYLHIFESNEIMSIRVDYHGVTIKYRHFFFGEVTEELCTKFTVINPIEENEWSVTAAWGMEKK